MTYATIKETGKRQAFTVVEIILDKNDPALDATFALQTDSFGTPKTTDNIAAYTGADFRTYRYSDQQLFGVDHFPGLIKVNSNPPKIDPGQSIGFRATAKATISDFVSNDIFELPSPYDDRRVEGSHFLKLLARNHVKNRRVRVIQGFNPFDYDEANAQIESYIIDHISLPNENGQVSINMIDELILVESAKAKIPTVSKGQLNGDITDTAVTLVFSSSIADEYGIATATGHIAIEKEIMSYTVNTSTTMTIVRAQFGSEGKAHSDGETMQKCVVFEDENIIDIITTIITDHTNIPSTYIPTADWAALKAGDLANYNLTNVLFKPSDVKKILNELIQLAGLSMYIDVIDNELVIVSIPDFATSVITFDETEHLIQGSVKVTQEDKDQITRQAIFWDKFDVTETNDDKNYRKKFQVIDGIVEQDADISTTSEPKPLKTNWLINSVEDNQLATNYSQRQVNRFSQIPLKVKFDVDQRYIGAVTGGNMWLGSIFKINTSKIVDGALDNVITTCQCIEIRPARSDGQWTITGLSYTAAVPIDADLFITQDQTDYLLTDDLTTTEAREYIVAISSGVTLGASTTSTFAFSQGAFFAGATLKLVNLGRVVGAGGKGGVGSTASPAGASCTLGTPGNGFVGGDAMDLTTDAEIDNGFGLIASGGGGGAGNLGICINEVSFAGGGSGGGGGQGQTGGDGGDGGVGSSTTGITGVVGTIAAPGDNGGVLGGVGGDIAAATGGAAGDAIQKNGNTVTITAGNNSEQLKGAVV